VRGAAGISQQRPPRARPSPAATRRPLPVGEAAMKAPPLTGPAPLRSKHAASSRRKRSHTPLPPGEGPGVRGAAGISPQRTPKARPSPAAAQRPLPVGEAAMKAPPLTRPAPLRSNMPGSRRKQYHTPLPPGEGPGVRGAAGISQQRPPKARPSPAAARRPLPVGEAGAKAPPLTGPAPLRSNMPGFRRKRSHTPLPPGEAAATPYRPIPATSPPRPGPRAPSRPLPAPPSAAAARRRPGPPRR